MGMGLGCASPVAAAAGAAAAGAAVAGASSIIANLIQNKVLSGTNKIRDLMQQQTSGTYFQVAPPSFGHTHILLVLPISYSPVAHVTNLGFQIQDL